MPEGPRDGWIKAKHPFLIVPKDEFEVRPVLDCSSTGLNQALAPWSMDLPTIKEFATLAISGGVLGKRDFRHGFHHQTIVEED